ncbi:hypothetical protein ES702_05745 [subsurface metagenome]
MPIKQPFMVKENMAAATASLELTAKVGESLLVKQLRVGALHSLGFCECLIDRLSVGFFYTGDINSNHLEQCSEVGPWPNVFERLIQLGVFNGYPIAEGETFEIKPAVVGATVVGAIIYEVHDAEDIKAEMDCGSKAASYMFLNYGTNTAAIAVDTYGPLDKTRNPSEYPSFPYGEVVPAGHEIDVMGILLKDWAGYVDNTAANMRYLRLTKDRKVLFNDDRRGIYSTQGMSYFTWGPIRQTQTDIKLFPEPLTFKAGDELNVELSGASTEITAEDVEIAFILKVRRV